MLALIAPIEACEADIALSIRKDAPDWMHAMRIDLMTGERIIPKRLIADHLSEMAALPSYGLEVFLNRIFIENHCRIASVVWSGVHDQFQFERRGFW